MEFWKDIQAFEGNYLVSNYGRVMNVKPYKHPIERRGVPRNYILKTKGDKDGYPMAKLSLNGVVYTRKVHRLVAQAFIPNLDDKPEVNHKDLIKTNNHVDNLEWVTSKENCHHHFRARGRFGAKVKLGGLE